ncbi:MULTISPECIES: AzlC family ABC transporter permease [unclassified Paenibacillus]|uniref:AzlC family ABC transporter permease n=1 Tax=unclassified Paenibacillus TaxID=185978 RepID=UPI00210D3A00|nr:MULTISPECIES: AzlC family ABC transporter permease [unclassified Paenibacillus]
MKTEAPSSENGSMAALPQGSFWLGVKDCVPTLLGYLSIGFAAGVVGRTSGLSGLEVVLMSTFLYAGSAQFVVSGMFAAGASAGSIILTVLFVNMRHLLLSAALSPYFRGHSAWKNVLLGSQLTDETFGVAIQRLRTGLNGGAGRWMLGLNMTAQLNWIAATWAGAYLGAWIPDPNAVGLPYALPAMFAGLLVMQIAAQHRKLPELLTAAGAAAIFIAALQVMPAGTAVIVAIVAAPGVGMAVERWR